MLQEHTEREATMDLHVSFESFLQQAKAMKNNERCTSPEDRSATPEVPENTFKKDLSLNTSTWSTTDTTEEYDLYTIANKLNDVYKDCNKVKILQVYADIIDFIILPKGTYINHSLYNSNKT